MVRRLAMAYFAGAVGALTASLALWIAGHTDLMTSLGVTLAPELTWAWLSPRLLWGSFFALGFPLVRRRGLGPVRSGLVLSLLPSLVELTLVLPRAGAGFLGLTHGGLTPFVVLATNAIWGWVIAKLMNSTGHS